MDAVFDLTGKVALVTGAGQGMGAGVATLLAGQGAVLAVNDLVEERAAETVEGIVASGGRAVAAPFDVTSHEAVEAGVAQAQEALGPVDILVNNAGVPASMALTRFLEMEPEEWSPYVDLNLYGVLHCSRAVLAGMCERGWGRIVTISSGAGQIGIPIGVALYGAGKGGAIAFMRHLAMEVASRGVTVNSLALGLMNNAGSDEQVKKLGAQIPVGRAGTPEDVGAAVAFIASDEASWLTGQTIGLNGGSVTS
jgi:3-oxoacyl-[acyl-carrier protein] reductase